MGRGGKEKQKTSSRVTKYPLLEVVKIFRALLLAQIILRNWFRSKARQIKEVQNAKKQNLSGLYARSTKSNVVKSSKIFLILELEGHLLPPDFRPGFDAQLN